MADQTRRVYPAGENSFIKVNKTAQGWCASGKTYEPKKKEIIVDCGELPSGEYDLWVELSAQDTEAVGHYLELAIVDNKNSVKHSFCIVNANHGRGPRMPYVTLEEGERVVIAAGDLDGGPNSVYGGTVNISHR